MKSAVNMMGCIAVALLLAGPIAKAQEAPVVTKFTDNAYSIFLAGCNSIVVIGDSGVLITDPCSSVRARLLKTEIAKLTGKKVNKIVLSHEHTDHVGGTEVFEGAQIIAQDSIRSVLLLDPLNQLPDRVDVTFRTELVIDMGTTQVELKHYGPAEGIANIVVYLPREGVVMLTDLWEGARRLTAANSLDATNMGGVRKIFQEVSKWKPKYVMDGHSSNKDPKVMYEHAQYFYDLHDAVLPRLQKVADDPNKLWEVVQELPKVISLPAYKGWENYEEFPRHVYRMAYSLAYGG